MRRLERTGYGAMFCDLFLDDRFIVKRAKNEEGRQKLRRELAFYKVLEDLSVDFPIPKRIQQTDDSYTMHFYKDHPPLYQIYWNTTTHHQQEILQQVKKYLHILHTSMSKPMSKQEYQNAVLLEVYTKPLSRYKTICGIVNDYTFTKVNGVDIDTFYGVLEWIREGVIECINKKESFEMCLIHGDCQFNNIVYNSETRDLVFLDPRGYFGNVETFGPVEYDSAKLLFALSGYDIFDTMDVTSLHSEKENLILPILWKENTFFQMRGLETYLFLSIWLSNAHSFLSNPKKVVFSYYYALYIASLVKRSAKVETK